MENNKYPQEFFDWVLDEITKLGSMGDEIPMAVVNTLEQIIKAASESGLSIRDFAMILGYLNMIIDRMPLSPLTGEDSEWLQTDVSSIRSNKRYYGLLEMTMTKDDGTSEKIYTDTKRVIHIDMITGQKRQADGIVRAAMDRLVPIQFPYVPIEIPALVLQFKIDEDEYTQIRAIRYGNREPNTLKYCFKNDESISLAEFEQAHLERIAKDKAEAMTDELFDALSEETTGVTTDSIGERKQEAQNG